MAPPVNPFESLVDPYEIDGHDLKFVHGDHRRRIYEWNGPEGSIQYFEILEKTPLGNHYHKEKDEKVEILAGSGEVYIQVVFSMNEQPVSHLHNRPLKAGDKLRVAPFEAHTFVLEAGSKMVCRSDQPWNSKDVYPFKLV